MATTSVMVFGEIELSTNRALAYAILVAQAAHAFMSAVIRSREAAKALEDLVGVLPSERLLCLTKEQRDWLKPRLQEVHKNLVDYLRSESADKFSRLPLLDGCVHRMNESTEELFDIIEDLVLRDDADFRSLVTACETNLKLPEEEAIAWVHD